MKIPGPSLLQGRRGASEALDGLWLAFFSIRASRFVLWFAAMTKGPQVCVLRELRSSLEICSNQLMYFARLLARGGCISECQFPLVTSKQP